MTTNNPARHPVCRPEIATLLRRGHDALLAAMEDTPRVLQTGDNLIEMGEPHEFVHAIESGWFARTRTIVDGRRQTIVIFLPGELCGTKTIFLERQPDAIQALTPASTRRVHYKEVCALAARELSVALLISWQLAQDERHLHDWNVRLGRGSAEERIAALLLEFRNRLRQIGLASDQGYAFPMTQQQISDHVGLTTVHVNRVLRRFREQEMVSVQKGAVTFHDNLAALEALARPVQDILATD